ncbi:MAG: LptF/LptG family permease, partial [Bdellovibrionota bacterium]|nr:LptF/LptG family permease [Bdellovibrionota bacterium]
VCFVMRCGVFMRVIHRYLITSFIGPFVLGSLFLIIFILKFQLINLVKVILSKDVPLSEVLALFGHIAISFTPLSIPISILFATMFTLSKLAEDSEIVAMRSFGFSKNKIFLPFLIIGVLIGLALYSVNLRIIPNSKTQFKNTVIKLTSKAILRNVKSEQFYAEIPKATIYAEKVSKRGTFLENVFIHIKNKEGLDERSILAKKGVLIKTQEGNERSPKIRLLLYDGNIAKINRSDKNVAKVLFKEYEFPIMSSDIKIGFVTRDGMRGTTEIIELRKSIKKQISKSNSAQQKKVDLNGLRRRLLNLEIEYWQRINNSIQCVVFVVLGFCLSFGHSRFKKKGFSGSLFMSIIGYYGIFFFLLSVVKKGGVPPSVAILTPSVMVMALCFFLMRRLDWVS